MIDLQARIPDEVPADTEGFVRLLRELHVIALMGGSLQSFYRPASPVADRIVYPGALYTAAARTRETVQGTLYLDGPRVNVSFAGGEAQHRALYASVGDEEAGAQARAFEEAGLDWGRVVTARSERETDPKPWFLPPRPMRPEHFETLRSDLDAAVRTADLSAAARFHQGFVRLHPFHCANQSVAMSLVNSALERGLGAMIPHFILDQLALRLDQRAYEIVFARAARALSVTGVGPVQRWAILRERVRQAWALLTDTA
jgi:hypothetical protein